MRVLGSTGPWVVRGDVRIWTEQFPADGPACLLVAGAGAISEFWPNTFCAALASSGFRVIRYDHRDAGNSTFVNFARAPYGVADLVDDAMAVLDAYGVRAAHIVGHSMGGFIAQLATMHHPSRVVSMTSVSSHTASPDVPGPPDATWEIMLANQPVGDLEQDLPGYMTVWRYLNGERRFDAEMAESYTRKLYSRNTETLPATNHVAIQADMADRAPALRKLDCPAMVIHGELDPLVPVQGGVRTAEAIRGSRLFVLPRGGHVFFDQSTWAEILHQLVGHLRGAERSAGRGR